MDLLGLLFLLVLFTFFVIKRVRQFRVGLNNFLVLIIAVLLGTTIFCFFTFGYRKEHLQEYIYLFLLMAGIGVFICAKKLGR